MDWDSWARRRPRCQRLRLLPPLLHTVSGWCQALAVARRCRRAENGGGEGRADRTCTGCSWWRRDEVDWCVGVERERGIGEGLVKLLVQK